MSLFRRKYTHKDGSVGYTWNYDFRVLGQRHKGSLGKLPQAEAEAAYTKMRAMGRESLARAKTHALEQRLGLSPQFDAFAPEYLAYYRTHAKPNSAQRHAYAYEALRGVFGSVRLADITPGAIEHYKQQRLAMGRSPVTINRELAFLKHLFRMAITWGRRPAIP